MIAWAQAAQSEEIAAFVDGAEADAIRAARDPLADDPPGPLDTPAHAVESATAEIRLMLHLTANAAAARVADARQLQQIPPTAAQARQGLLTWPKLRILIDAADGLTAEQAARLQEEVLPAAPTRTTGQLRAAVRRFLTRLADDDHDLDDRRRRRRQRTRSVSVQAEPDGMATLRVVLPAAAATGIYAVLDEHARGCPASDSRTMDHRRADALTDLVLRDTGLVSSGTARAVDPADGEETVPGVSPAPAGGSPFVRNSVSVQIRVTVPLDTLVGSDDEPAELAGYGPIPASDARALAFDPASVWFRLLTDPLSGAVLDHGTERYRPPTALDRHVRSRQATCDFPGCRVPAHRCDVDHTVAFDPATGTGPTSADNTRARCRPHHRLKHMRDWAVEPRDDGATVWCTPSGHTYVTEPEPIGPRPRPRAWPGRAPRGPGIRALLTDPGAAAQLVDDDETSPF